MWSVLASLGNVRMSDRDQLGMRERIRIPISNHDLGGCWSTLERNEYNNHIAALQHRPDPIPHIDNDIATNVLPLRNLQHIVHPISMQGQSTTCGTDWLTYIIIASGNHIAICL